MSIQTEAEWEGGKWTKANCLLNPIHVKVTFMIHCQLYNDTNMGKLGWNSLYETETKGKAEK